MTGSDLDDALMTRRSSSSGLLSPDVESPRTDGEQDGFYLLKKDSQRRTTLTKVLVHDQQKIVQIWFQRLQQELGSAKLLLTQDQLVVIMVGLREYIPEQKKLAIEQAFASLKNETEFEETVNQIHLALYTFQDAVNDVLKSHSIKPHWMFALDNLVRSSVHCAITVLSPDHESLLGSPDENIGVLGGSPGRPHDAVEEGSTSGVSTINSTKSAKLLHDFHHSKQCHQLQEKFQAARAENLRLLEELSLAEKRYGDLLKMYLSDRREQSRLLAEQLGVPLPPVLKPEESKAEGDNVAESTENIGSAENTCSKRRCVEVRGEELESPAGTMGSQSSAETVTGESIPEDAASPSLAHNPHEPPMIHVSSRNIDMELVAWLQALSIDRDVIDKFLAEDYTKDDVLLWMTRDDLRRMQMRGGVELRIWRNVVQYRHSQGLPVNPEEPSASCNTPKSSSSDSHPRSTKL